MAKFCGNCGKMLEDASRFCNICGAPCEAEPQSHPPVRQEVQPQQSCDAPPIMAPYGQQTVYPPLQPPIPSAQRNRKKIAIILCAVAVVLIAGIVLLIVLNPFASDGAGSVQALMNQIADAEIGVISVDEAVQLIYEYQYGNEQTKESIDGYMRSFEWEQSRDDFINEMKTTYGDDYRFSVTITDQRAPSGDEYQEYIGYLEKYARTDSIEEIALISGSSVMEGSKGKKEEPFSDICVIKAGGKWYFSACTMVTRRIAQLSPEVQEISGISH